jgi:hypothetical protein
MKEYFSKRPETKINPKGLSKIKRSDGSITFIPADYWQAAEETNPIETYLKLTKQSSVYYIRAKNDHLLAGEDYSQLSRINDIKLIEIEGDHDFGDGARVELINSVRNILAK